ncbi:MAG: hypothetical protein IJV35_04970 [Neisseriaceae bacterium]|nr:hypothetical protein [Neisseriaceae bacterium]
MILSPINKKKCVDFRLPENIFALSLYLIGYPETFFKLACARLKNISGDCHTVLTARLAMTVWVT